MNLGQIIALTRQGLADEKMPHLWTDAELANYATDAERELARRLYLLNDSDTVGYVTLSGTGGQVDSLSVAGVAITGGAVAYSTDLATTAENLAANINAMTSVPNYRAVARGLRVVIKANPGTGYPAASYSLAAAVSGGTLGATTTILSGLCRHVLAVGQRFLPLHSKVVRITRFKPGSVSRPIGLYTKDDMDYSMAGWEALASGSLVAAVPDYKRREVIVVPPPSAADVIETDCDRLPLFDLTAGDLNAIPEIGEEYHIDMTEWMKRQAYRKNDVETLDLNRSKQAEAEFDRRVEAWRVEHIRRQPGASTNRVPGGLL